MPNKLKPRFFHCPQTLCLLCLTLGLSGCSETADPPAPKTASAKTQEPDSAEGNHPQTFEEAVKAVVSIDDTIKKAFAAKDDDAAHGPLHKVGHLLEDLNGLAEKADMSDEQRKSVKAAVEKLFEAFGAVDEKMHGEEGKTYDDVASLIEENLKVLTDLATMKLQEADQ